MGSLETKITRGSEWHRWDLHVHTIASSLSHSFGDNWDTYVEKLIDAIHKHKISAIATADYFTIEGYRKLLTYYDSSAKTLSVNGKNAEVLLIPGVELRLNIFNSDQESINLHIFFDPEHCFPDFITSNFLERLHVRYRGTDHLLKTQDLLVIGKSIVTGNSVPAGTDFTKTPDQEKQAFLKEALRVITLSKNDIGEALKEIDEIFEKQNLPPRTYLIAAVGKGHGGLRSLKWFEENKKEVFSRSGLIREDITHQADLIFSNDKSDRAFYLGQDHSTPPEEIQQRFRHLKPCVWGSDSHDLENLLHPSNGQSSDYTWIKSVINFEGLKQIVFEPDLRVRIQEDNPSESETYSRIETCEIDFPEDLSIQAKDSTETIPFCLRGKYGINFSNNLSCIVGGRGSGKSTLVHLLYNAWENRELDKLYKLDSPLFNLRFDGDSVTSVRKLVIVDIPPDTEFFLQNEIEKFAKDVEEMSTLVRHRLERLSSIEDGQRSLKELAGDWVEASTGLVELIAAHDKITAANAEIVLLEKQITTLKKQTDVIKSEEYKSLQKSVEGVAGIIRDFDIYEKEYKRLTSELASLSKIAEKLTWEKFGSQDALSALRDDLGKHRAALQQVFESAKKRHDEAKYPDMLAERKASLRKYLHDKGMAEENIGELAEAAQQIATLQAQIKELRGEIAPFEDTYGRKDETLRSYQDNYDIYRTRFFAVSEKLQTSLAGLKFSETEITFRPKTNDQALRDAVVEFVKLNNTSKTVLSTDNIQSVLFDHGASVEDLVDDPNKLRKATEDSQKATIHTQILRELLSSDVFLERLNLLMHKHHFDINNIQVQTKLGEKNLQNTSFGERCGIVIAIVLVAGTNPIVIDQPEDNLDGKFISNVLVPLIQKQKQSRQIILVTRDANLVIGGDSELIDILESEDGKTAVIPSAIEDKEGRQKYIWILDGGEKAFQTREQKYNLP